jgi:hypothetical protein
MIDAPSAKLTFRNVEDERKAKQLNSLNAGAG